MRLNIIAKQKDCIVIETPLNGFSTARIDEIYFRFNGKSFSRTFNLEDYSSVEDDLRKYFNVELTIIPITADIAKIESLNLRAKLSVIDRKGGKRRSSMIAILQRIRLRFLLSAWSVWLLSSIGAALMDGLSE